MKILRKSLLSATLLALIAPCINAESQDKTTSNQVQAQKKETEAQKLGRELLELLQSIVKKHLKMCCPCFPGNQSCAVDTKTDAEIKQEQEEKEKNIQKAIDLIEKGADVNYENGIGASPLGAAVMLDNLELVKLLLQKNANPEPPEPSEISSPLIANIMFGEKIEIAKLLIENGANVNFQTWNGQTPLMLAVSKNKLELVMLLIEKGADVNTQGKMEMAGMNMSFTALAMAVGMQNLPMVELLLESGADLSIKYKDGRSQDKYKDGKTVLEQAKELGNKELIDLLLKYETNSNQVEVPLRQASDDAKAIDDRETEAQKLGKELLELLQSIIQKHVKMCCPCCPGNQSCAIDTKTEADKKQDQKEKEKNIQKAIDLIEKGADVNYENGIGASPLGAAVMLDSLELVKLLLQKNANPEPSEISSPLIANIMFGEKIEIAKLLIENGANVNFQMNKSWQTPLMLAVAKNKLKVAKLLIEKGADVNTQAKMEMQGMNMSFTALAMAVGMQNLPMAELLLENGADPSIKNKDGQNQEQYKDGKAALEQAKELGNKELIDLLLKYETKK